MDCLPPPKTGGLFADAHHFSNLKTLMVKSPPRALRGGISKSMFRDVVNIWR